MNVIKLILLMSLVGFYHSGAAFEIIPLETDRLLLRAVSIDDTIDIAQIALDQRVTMLTGLFPEMQTIEEVQDFVNSFLIGYQELGIMPRYPQFWSIVEKATGRVIGLIGFVAHNKRHQRVELAYAIAYDYWNQGYATEAAHALICYAFTQGVVRISATVDPEHHACERVLHKLHMHYEGLMRSYMLIDGKRVDRKIYAIIAK